MKLCTFGEGLCRTHVTWEEIQENVKKVFGDSAVFGEKKSVTTIGDGRGFMSKMCLIDPDWKNELKFAPKKFIVKICTQIMSMEMAEKLNMTDSAFFKEEFMDTMAPILREIHNNEVKVYSTLKKYVKNDGLAVPKVFYAEKFSEKNPCKGYLIMEYIENAENINLYDNMKVEDLKQPLRALAVLQAAALNFTEEEKKSLDMSVMELVGKMCTEEATKTMIGMLRKGMGERLPEKVDIIEQMAPEIIDVDFVGKISEQLGMPPVFLHGDLWSSNMIWKKNEDGSMQLAAIIDFQTSGYGNPATDLCRLLNSSLSAKDRKAHEKELIDTFYGYLEEEVKEHEMPYTREQLHESVQRFKPFSCYLLVHGIGQLFEINTQITDPEEKQKMMDQIYEKTEGLMDDIIEYQERNREIIKEMKSTVLDN